MDLPSLSFSLLKQGRETPSQFSHQNKGFISYVSCRHWAVRDPAGTRLDSSSLLNKQVAGPEDGGWQLLGMGPPSGQGPLHPQRQVSGISVDHHLQPALHVRWIPHQMVFTLSLDSQKVFIYCVHLRTSTSSSDMLKKRLKLRTCVVS